MFSRRSRPPHQPKGEETASRIARAVEERRRLTSTASPLLDLTISNPTTAALTAYDQVAITSALASPKALIYEPEPLGLPSARAVIAKLCSTTPERIAITTSTSEAYAILFKVLCDPGDQILVPTPSYPLLEWLANFESVELVPYPLTYAADRWHVDVGALEKAITPRAKAIVVVHPNNPTGSYLSASELEAMLDLNLPIISDEVFLHYSFGREARYSLADGVTRSLVFSLSGLSKLAGLPQMKLGWIHCAGDEERSRLAMARLESVLDAYLSVGAPVQHALPELLEVGERVRDAIRARTAKNLAEVEALLRGSIIRRLHVEGGWYVTLRVPETRTDEEWALTLINEDGVYVHPGYFFDIHRGAHLVVSLLTPERELEAGMKRIRERVQLVVAEGT